MEAHFYSYPPHRSGWLKMSVSKSILRTHENSERHFKSQDIQDTVQKNEIGFLGIWFGYECGFIDTG